MLTEEQRRRHLELAGEKKPSMLRRKDDHDYSIRCQYLITMTTTGRVPYFGNVAGDPLVADGPTAPHIDLSALGTAIAHEWYGIPNYYPQIRIVALQMMPDHFHGIIFVQEELPCSLGKALNGFKTGCRRLFRELLPVQYADAKRRHTEQVARLMAEGKGKRQAERAVPGILFSQGYNDKILLRQGQLGNWLRYLADNPRRLLLKRLHPEFLRVQSSLAHKGMTFSAVGNRFLLQHPLLIQVQCSRSLTEEQIQARVDQALTACADDGAVLVSPAISKGEKAIMRAALDAGFPEIVLKNNGFTPLTKPGGQGFDRCAKGQILILGPTWHDNERKTITRYQCLNLNDIARKICE